MLRAEKQLEHCISELQPQIAATQIMRAESEYDTLLKSDFAKTRESPAVGKHALGWFRYRGVSGKI